ncbi:DNA primase [Nitzschia inconspicua]|uniref:DNA primase n=1 Tax=Nitzschia inconspicua TaxID=303405 RepID=A0A9K3PZX0_9STRA|nr:DNA primase [Nitzschia inconspicua]
MSVGCRRSRMSVSSLSMLFLLSMWRIQQGISFVPVMIPAFFSRQKPFLTTSLRDAEDPLSVKVSGLSTISPTLNGTQSSSSSRITATINPPLRMPREKASRRDNGKNNNNMNSKHFVSTEDLARLQDAIDIVSLIECYGIPQFSKSGTRASCLCPFHDDHNPSLKIDGSRGIFKCFSCGVGGIALSFVREYAKVHGTELSFLQAVKLLDDMVASSSSGSKLVLPIDITVPMGARPPARNVTVSKGYGFVATKSSKSTTVTTSTTSQQRVKLANLHAAAFYEECLLTRLDAGGARMHLRSRGVHPSTVKAFAIGFAPETYFTSVSSTTGQSQEWGEGSLVNYLRDKGFRPQEIIDAGLAIRTKRGKQQLEQQQQQQKQTNSFGNETNSTFIGDCDYLTLMDRFRGRLIVPIFDATGHHVLGFGGRILESAKSGSDFKAAKYLNSPESVVFQKKEILFGKHLAEKAAEAIMKSKKKESYQPRSLIVVEGYMDAIAMWQAGIRETVASMGTAISLEQLESATGSARKIGVGRVVLCLDNDDAGIAAVERLCSGQRPILLSATENSNVEVHVAQLPASVKDPAEFLEKIPDKDGLDSNFRKEVIEQSVEWTEWYIERLLSSFDASAIDEEDGSFPKTFERLASFLSVFDDLDQRTKKASLMAQKLSPLVGGDSQDADWTSSQLESDLLHKASVVSRSSSLRAQATFEIFDNDQLSCGRPPSEVFLSRSLEISQDLSDIEGRSKIGRSTPKKRKLLGREAFDEPSARKPKSKKVLRMKRSTQTVRTQKSMTPHIGSLQPGTLDDVWLRGSLQQGPSDRKHLRYEITAEGSRTGKFKQYIGPEKSVRFNHNDYHGTWSSTEASMAGYTTTGSLPRNLDFLDKGTISLIETSKADISVVAEDLLLRLLLRFSESRRSVGETLRVSKASRSGAKIHWSQPEKEWLFECLIEDHDDIPTGGTERLKDMRSYLVNRVDSYPGAISDIDVLRDDDDVKVQAFSPSNPDRDVTVVEQRLKATTETSVNKSELATDASAQHTRSVPSIGDDWVDFVEMDGLDPVLGFDGTPDFSSPTITDEYMDSIPVVFMDENGEQESKDMSTTEAETEYMEPSITIPEKVESSFGTESSETLDVEFVAANISPRKNENLMTEGSLDYLFRDDNNDLDQFTGSDYDEITSQRGDHALKAAWAAQDLHIILQTTSVLHRVQAGRKYILKQATDSGRESSNGEIVASTMLGLHIMNETELAEYCSPQCSNGGLRDDLHLVRTLMKSNQRARKRMHALLLSGFSDQSTITRGYNWLNNVLRFNDMKMMQWNDIVEAKAGFKMSPERLEDLEEIVESEWNELTNEDEMWEWNKNVNLDHVSHIAQTVKRDPNPETASALSKRIEEEWGWAIGDVEIEDGHNHSIRSEGEEEDDDDDSHAYYSEDESAMGEFDSEQNEGFGQSSDDEDSEEWSSQYRT